MRARHLASIGSAMWSARDCAPLSRGKRGLSLPRWAVAIPGRRSCRAEGFRLPPPRGRAVDDSCGYERLDRPPSQARPASRSTLGRQFRPYASRGARRVGTWLARRKEKIPEAPGQITFISPSILDQNIQSIRASSPGASRSESCNPDG